MNFAWMWAKGKRPNPVKVALLGTSIGFWWFCNNGVANILAGIALFEVFHDVQYLSLVWIYNRNRVEKDTIDRRIHAFCFSPQRLARWTLYRSVFAYGSVWYFKAMSDVETIKRVLTGVVTHRACCTFITMALSGKFANVRRASRSDWRAEPPMYRWAGFFPAGPGTASNGWRCLLCR